MSPDCSSTRLLFLSVCIECLNDIQFCPYLDVNFHEGKEGFADKFYMDSVKGIHVSTQVILPLVFSVSGTVTVGAAVYTL